MYKRHVLGREGEDIACKYLLENNYEIIDRNFSCREGEIDIIAREGDEIVFCEVKTRTNVKYGQAIESITYYKQKHIIRTIQYYLFKVKLNNVFVRIDVLEVYKMKEKYYINHIKNAISR